MEFSAFHEGRGARKTDPRGGHDLVNRKKIVSIKEIRIFLKNGSIGSRGHWKNEWARYSLSYHGKAAWPDASGKKIVVRL